MNELQETGKSSYDINPLKEVKRVVHEAFDDLTTVFQEYEQLRNHHSAIALSEAVQKIDDTVDGLNPTDANDLVQAALRISIDFLEVIARLIEIEMVMRNLLIVEIRESIIFDSSIESLRKAIKKLMEFENHNVLEQYAYKKYPQALIDSTKADIDRLIKSVEVDSKTPDENEEEEEDEDRYIYLYKNGKRQMSDWDFLQKTGLHDKFKKGGTHFPPLHNCELLKADRLEIYEGVKERFIQDRKTDGLETSALDLNLFYYKWLKGQLNSISGWLSPKFPNGTKKPRSLSDSNQIEVIKYKAFITSEMNATELLINPPDTAIFELPERTKVVIESLNEYRFSEFLRAAGYNVNDIYNLLAEHSGRGFVPYTIALLNELKYLDYFFKEFPRTKVQGCEMLSKIFEVPSRRIKGNINVLSESSLEDPAQYTSHAYITAVRKELEGL